MIAYPNILYLSIGSVTLPLDYIQSKIYIQTATKMIYLGTNIQTLLLHSGDNTLQVVTGERKQLITISVKTNSKQELQIQKVDKPLKSFQATPLTPRSSAFCYTLPPEKFTGPLAFFNWGRVQFAERADIKTKNLAPFTQQSVLKIQVNQDAKIKCDNACKYGLESLFAEAIAVWRSGCSRCNPNALVLIQVDSATWLDWRLERRLNIDGATLDLNDVLPEETQEFKSSPSWVGGQVVPYVNITKSQKLFDKICALPANKAVWASAVKAMKQWEFRPGTKDGTPVAVRIAVDMTFSLR